MSASIAPNADPSLGARSSRPVWTLVLTQELRELWIGGRALNLLVLYSLLMSGTAFLLATNNELSLATPRLAMVVMLQSAITFGLFIGLVIAAESVSGERERATLEPLLLTPADRRQVLLGKYVAALSPWPAAMLLAVPYIVVLAQGDVALGIALMWGALLGTLLVASFTGIGLLVSIWSGSSRSSLFIALLVYLLALLPAQLPGEFAASPAGVVVQVLVPLESVRQFLNQYLVDLVALDAARVLLVAPTAALLAILVVLFGVAAPRLGLDGASPSIGRWVSGETNE